MAEVSPYSKAQFIRYHLAKLIIYCKNFPSLTPFNAVNCFNCTKLCNFAVEMKRSDKWTNLILVVLIAVLAAICIGSVVHEQQRANKRQVIRDGRNY